MSNSRGKKLLVRLRRLRGRLPKGFRFDRAFDSVWDALERSGDAAESMKARARLMMEIQKAVRSWEVSQSVGSRRLGISQPCLNDLLRGKIDRFSLDALFDLATHAGLKVSVGIRKAA
jgi:predicted XRE-type DNA-binding protein